MLLWQISKSSNTAVLEVLAFCDRDDLTFFNEITVLAFLVRKKVQWSFREKNLQVKSRPRSRPRILRSLNSYVRIIFRLLSKHEKNFSLKERKAHFLSLTQYSLGVELKFVECVNFCCWAWLKYAVTLKENPLNVTWFWWAWLKSLLTLIKNLLNVKTILLLEFCTIWLSIYTWWFAIHAKPHVVLWKPHNTSKQTRHNIDSQDWQQAIVHETVIFYN